VALTPDWHLERPCDAVLSVTATAPEQIARLMRARGWSEPEARARLGAQRTDQEFARAADVVLENHGTPEALIEAARAALRRLLEARRNAAGPQPAPKAARLP